jgi:hypothetical protein
MTGQVCYPLYDLNLQISLIGQVNILFRLNSQRMDPRSRAR